MIHQIFSTFKKSSNDRASEWAYVVHITARGRYISDEVKRDELNSAFSQSIGKFLWPDFVLCLFESSRKILKYEL